MFSKQLSERVRAVAAKISPNLWTAVWAIKRVIPIGGSTRSGSVQCLPVVGDCEQLERQIGPGGS